MSVAASRYAKALLDVLHPAKAEMGREQLLKFSSLLSQHAEARVLLENPTVSGEKRKELLARVGDALALESPIRNFLSLLVDRNRLELLDEIVQTYETLLDEKLGVVRARVTSAQDLDTKQRDEVVSRLQALTGKKVRMEVFVDPSLIGGLVAQVGSTIYDGSIRQRLQSFRDNLTQD
ncbi:MAG TPA: F0F1 ATP synthase subunit delta [Terriglobia bacterium]|nr:F0F1 ATP synthase subunit delta [Terriglobia bacterium]